MNSTPVDLGDCAFFYGFTKLTHPVNTELIGIIFNLLLKYLKHGIECKTLETRACKNKGEKQTDRRSK